MSSKRWWQVAQALCGVLMMSGLFGRGALSEHWLHTRPRAPDPANGFVHAVLQHGLVVYVTDHERLFYNGLFLLAALGVVVGVVIEARVNPFGRRARP